MHLTPLPVIAHLNFSICFWAASTTHAQHFVDVKALCSSQDRALMAPQRVMNFFHALSMSTSHQGHCHAEHRSGLKAAVVLCFWIADSCCLSPPHDKLLLNLVHKDAYFVYANLFGYTSWCWRSGQQAADCDDGRGVQHREQHPRLQGPQGSLLHGLQTHDSSAGANSDAHQTHDSSAGAYSDGMCSASVGKRCLGTSFRIYLQEMAWHVFRINLHKKRQPVSQFMASAQTRARYWARSFAGWHDFSRIEPNAAHESLARLQQRGWVNGIITQV